jgi:type I restriction enzyme R subunit
VVLFINGMPLAVIELKNPSDENATIESAYNQLQTYKQDIPSLFNYNCGMVISDGYFARAGTLTSDRSRYTPWKTIDGKEIVEKGYPELEVLVKGMFNKQVFLDLIRYFSVFEVDRSNVVKKVAAYHQYHSVNKAVECTLKAASPKGDGRVGVIWHTQGSGKSLSMAFYAGKIIQQSELANPTLVVLTDRNDLDEQLFGTFSKCSSLLRQTPAQADSRKHLKELLQVASGGVVFTTVQKFMPEKGEMYPLLSERKNIIFIADEAHRSHYGHVRGFARNIRDALPNASFIGFTGTPIELEDKSTPAVFGNYIDIYDIQRAVDDGATVPIYYEGRLAKIELKPEEKPQLDPEFDEITENEEEDEKEKLKSKWSQLEALVGTEKRIGLVAQDIVDHFEKRSEALNGKAIIVGMSRRICVDMYNAITKLKPEWHDTDDDKGIIKVVMSGSASDKLEWQPHIRNKQAKEDLANRFRDPDDPFSVVIVRDMWLTGFDAPCLHTMYVDKPMHGHGLMQAIARVNRVFGQKQGGLVVDYLGLAHQLKKALGTYANSGGKGKTAIDIGEAVAVLMEKYEIAKAMLHGYDYSSFNVGDLSSQLELIKNAAEHILAQDDGKKRFLTVVSMLTKAFSLVPTEPDAVAIRDDVAFFQEVRTFIRKTTKIEGDEDDSIDYDVAIKQLISRAVATDEVLDIFKAVGLDKPDISILSDEFLQEVKNMPQKNLAFELLKKLLNDEIKSFARTNLVMSRSFSEMLENSIKQYQNRTIEAAQVIAELIKLAKEMREAHKRGEEIGLTEDELAFYDALETNDSAVMLLGDDILKTIAHDLVDTVKRNTTIDWTVKESVRAKLRVMVRRILKKHGYPPDKQEKATQTVLAQAELISEKWVG